MNRFRAEAGNVAGIHRVQSIAVNKLAVTFSGRGGGALFSTGPPQPGEGAAQTRPL